MTGRKDAAMKKSVRAKLRSKKGETIGETLIALLISSLALLMLAGAISAAAKVVTSGKAAIEQYYTVNWNGTRPTASPLLTEYIHTLGS